MEKEKLLIIEYISEDDCTCDILYDCGNCRYLKDCYIDANMKCNVEFTESIGYGGCSSFDEFWEQLN